MTFERLPRHAIVDILRYIAHDDAIPIFEILSLRLVCHRLNTDVLHVVYNQDAAKIHRRLLRDGRYYEPRGISLERIVRGFVGRSKSSTQALRPIWRSLRDGVWILSVLLLDQSTKKDVSVETSESKSSAVVQKSSLPVAGEGHQQISTGVEPQDTENIECDGSLPDQALLCVCKAYIELLGERAACSSLDSTWRPGTTTFEKLNNKTGHFWALLAAVQIGGSQVINAAINACTDRSATEDGQSTLKVNLAAGLMVAARKGDIDSVTILLAQPATKLNLRLQNMRFAGENAMEAAIAASQPEIIKLLLHSGWDLTTLPSDYIRALRATAGRMKMSPMRDELLKTLIEGDRQQWRSGSILAGLYYELCKQGDLKTCQHLLSLLKSTTKSHDNWQWMFVDNGENDHVAGPLLPSTFNDDFDGEPVFRDIFDEEKTALFQAVSTEHHDLITFLFENRDSLPESMLDNFTVPTRLRCLERSIDHHDPIALTKLLPHIGEICPQKLFLYATIHDNVHAMTTLLPLIDLTSIVHESDPFFLFSQHNSCLAEDMDQLDEPDLHPNNFLFQGLEHQPRHVKLGTFTLLCAIKSLRVKAATFLLSHNCTIGTRTIILSANLLDWRFARIYLPHDISTCMSCQRHAPKMGKWVVLLALTRFSYLDWKHMTEAGAEVPIRRSVYITRKNWFKVWRWRTIDFEVMDARIVTGVQVPERVLASLDRAGEEVNEKYEEMQTLLSKHRLPHIFTDMSCHDRW